MGIFQEKTLRRLAMIVALDMVAVTGASSE